MYRLDKQLIKINFSLLGKYLIALTMSFIVTISFFMIFTVTSESGETVSGVPYVIMLILSEICSLGTLIVFLNGKIYYIGDSDANKVHFGRIEYDKFKGLKMGIAPAVLALGTYIVLVLGKLGIIKDYAYMIFNLANYHLYGYHQMIFGGNNKLSEISWLSIAAAFLTVILVPLTTHICYTLGYKRINLGEKLMFKKKGDK